jgi:5-methylcytosine-specific restriction endonuclease McrA
MAKSKRAKLTVQLDDLCRDIIRLIYEDTCQKCGKKVYDSNSHPCHVIPKGNGASWRRFDFNNLFLGCLRCHRWWHDNPTESAAWFKLRWPWRDEYLEKYRNGKPAKISTPEMVELVEKYKIKLKELKQVSK